MMMMMPKFQDVGVMTSKSNCLLLSPFVLNKLQIDGRICFYMTICAINNSDLKTAPFVLHRARIECCSACVGHAEVTHVVGIYKVFHKKAPFFFLS